MSQTIERLYPPPYRLASLHGLYLSLRLHTLGKPGRPFVYANFLSSLDGRIALEAPEGLPFLPKSLTTPNDFRLFLELQAQADCLITHGGYLRSLQAGRLGNILQIGQRPESAELTAWREGNGLEAQPAIVVASASLDFPMPDSIREHRQTCLIATGRLADPAKVAHWQAQGYEVIVAGSGRQVEGGPLTEALACRGLQSLYLIAGPDMLETMLRDGKLNRLFLTTTHQLLGGTAFRTVSPGPEYGLSGHLQLRCLYYDAQSPAGSGQWFSQFDVHTSSSIP